jgi:hypothetical protein
MRDQRLGRLETRHGRVYFVPGRTITDMTEIHCGLEDEYLPNFVSRGAMSKRLPSRRRAAQPSWPPDLNHNRGGIIHENAA